MGEIRGRVHSVESFGALDGPGIRYVLFLQGCPLRCRYCHNPDTWDAQGGKWMTAGEAVEDIWRYRNFIRTGGVTLSGGEPLLQSGFAAQVLRLCREQGIHTAIDTSGSVSLELCREAVDQADLLLLDIKAMDSQLCKQLTGRDNASAINLLDYCEAQGKPVWIRHVLVPGLTLEEKPLRSLAGFLDQYTCIQRVELLPFHKMGEYKWEALHLPYTLKDTPPPTEQQVAWAKSFFQNKRYPVR